MSLELQKELRRKKPIAILISINKSGLKYLTRLEDRDDYIYFTVPLDEIGDATWLPEMPSQLLIRYLIQEEKDAV